MTSHTSSLSTASARRDATLPSFIRSGAISAQVVAGTYVVGFLAMGAYLGPRGFVTAVDDPAGSLAFLLANQPAMCLWYLVLYLLGGAAMAVVALGVADRLRETPLAARLSGVLGLIWSGMLVASGSIAVVGQHAVVSLTDAHPAAAESTWVTVSIIQDALGGGVEVIGALWLAVVGYAMVRARAVSVVLGGLALGLAAVGLVSVLPFAAATAVSIFGIGLIVWFTWLGLTLNRR